MPLDAVKGRYYRSDLERYEQGDILRDVTLVQWAEVEPDREVRIVERTLQYCVIVSQECDLEHDFNNRNNATRKTEDKFLQSLLVCPAYRKESFCAGEHLKELDLRMEPVSAKLFERLVQNQNARYHYLASHLELQIPELIVDFKHYMTVPPDVLYQERFSPSYLATLEILFRDSLSGRFSQYLSRIGLPDGGSSI